MSKMKHVSESSIGDMSKLRVWWIPQVGIEKTFYVP